MKLFAFCIVVLAAMGLISGVARGDDPAATRPAGALPIDQVVKIPPISLKTAGHSPKEAYDMLGQAAGVKFIPGRDRRVPGAVNVWDSQQYPDVNFDLEGVNFWGAAMKLGEFARVIPEANYESVTLQSMSLYPTMPNQVIDTPAMRVSATSGLSFTFPPGGIPQNTPLIVLEFMLDPRIHVLRTGELSLDAVRDDAGNELATFPQGIDSPGRQPMMNQVGSAHTVANTSHGIHTFTSQVYVTRPQSGNRIGLFKGSLPVVVATETQTLEYAMADGIIKDLAVKKIGGWSVSISDSSVIPLSAGGAAGHTGPFPDDRSFTLKIERDDEQAPRLPSNIALVAQFDTSLLGGRPVIQGLSGTWTVRFVNNPKGNQNPPTKLILTIPTKAQAAVLPFEFKDIELRAR